MIAGVAFKKTFSYAGFEMQPKRYENLKIALLNVELELKAEKDNAEVRVKSVEVGSLQHRRAQKHSELSHSSLFHTHFASLSLPFSAGLPSHCGC